MSRPTTKKKPAADTYDPAADSIGSYYAAIEAKRKRGEATRQDSPPLDYADWEDTPHDDEPYNRCPFCNAAIAGIVAAAIIGGLMLAAFAIKEMMTWLM